MITETHVRALVGHLEAGRSDLFLAQVRDDVEWTVNGRHLLAGVYPSKADFVAGTYARFAKVLEGQSVMRVLTVLVADDAATVEMTGRAMGKDGKPYENVFCWLFWFDGEGRIAKVHAYLDSVAVNDLFERHKHLL